MDEKDSIIIFDTTLRDGEQSPGASLTPKEKFQIGQQLAKLGVDVIETGFPISSPGDFEACSEIAQRIKGPIICGLARSLKEDIDIAYKAVKKSHRPRIHVFLATSKIHMRYKLKKAEDEILKQAVWATRYAKKRLPDVEFSPEDASRSDRAFLYKVCEAVIEAGATTINIPDTVGYAMPEEFGSLIGDLRRHVANIRKGVISVHCHNDLGLAVANSLAALKNGARQIECTINGIGERAGNASLEEIVMAIKTREDLYGVETQVDSRQIYKTSRFVSKLTGIPVQPNKAIVGRNAFAHEAGIHQDGILKRRTTYEILKPSDVGIEQSHLVLGKHSGRHAFQVRLKNLGYTLKRKDLDRAFKRFKQLADKKKEVFEEDLRALVEDEVQKIPPTYELNYLHITSGTQITPTAIIKLKDRSGKIKERSSNGDGPVDACYRAIDKMTGLRCKLLDYSLQAVTRGKDALGEVRVKIKSKKKEVGGVGASTDIIEASAKAYVNAVNKLLYKKKP